MSWWLWPTTADVGIKAFSDNPSKLMDELILGMQSIVLSEPESINSDQIILGEIECNFAIDRTLDRLAVRILEEVLYNCEVNNRWIISSKTMFSKDMVHIIFYYVNSDLIKRDVEIKAITRHSLEFKELNNGETIPSENEIPEMIGPGWYSSVIFDL